jgi:tRNA wybutosine-synthesizing protein 1
MANVPWHEEVVKFVRLLCERLPQFDLACEHEHSNCLLLANTKVKNILKKKNLYEILF